MALEPVSKEHILFMGNYQPILFWEVKEIFALEPVFKIVGNLPSVCFVKFWENESHQLLPPKDSYCGFLIPVADKLTAVVLGSWWLGRDLGICLIKIDWSWAFIVSYY